MVAKRLSAGRSLEERMPSLTRTTWSAVVASVALVLAAAPAVHAAEPKLTVAKSRLKASLKCVGPIDDAARTPVMIVTGTGASGDEAYAIGKGAIDAYGAPVCYVNFPHFTTADLQVSVQYLVHGLRVMSRRAGRKVAILGISQGALLPRVALTYWPRLRRKVSDVVGAAGPHHGTTNVRFGRCGSEQRPACIPAGWQQAAGSKFLRALNAQRDETPGPTAWTTARSATDETVRPQTGRHPTSALKGATNVLVQDVCPGRQVTHIGTVLDSVTFALFKDAVRHAGPAKVSRLPDDVCSHPYAPGLDEAQTTALLGGAGSLTSGRYDDQPQVTREPKLRAWVKRRTT
jgi:triacylglycerol lipase